MKNLFLLIFWLASDLFANFFSNKQPTAKTQIYKTSSQTYAFSTNLKLESQQIQSRILVVKQANKKSQQPTVNYQKPPIIRWQLSACSPQLNLRTYYLFLLE